MGFENSRKFRRDERKIYNLKACARLVCEEKKMLRISLLDLQCDLMRKKTTPTPHTKRQTSKTQHRAIGSIQIDMQGLVSTSFAEEITKSFFQYLCRYVLTFAWKKQNYYDFGCLLLWFEDGTSNTFQSRKKLHKLQNYIQS